MRGLSTKGLPALTRRFAWCLPLVLLALLLLGGIAETLFQHDQSRRIAALAPAQGIATRLLTAAQGALRLPAEGEDEGAARLALEAAHAAAGSLTDSLAAIPPAAALLPAPPPVDALVERWQAVVHEGQGLLDAARAGGALRRQARSLEGAFIRLRVNSLALLQAMVTAEASPVQLGAAARQLALAERLAAGARSLALGEELLSFADRVGRDAVAFGSGLDVLETGSDASGVPRVTGEDAQDILTGLGREFRQVVPLLEPVLDTAARDPVEAPDLLGLGSALQATAAAAAAYREALDARAAARVPTPAHLVALAALTLAVCAVVLLGQRREAASQRAVADEAQAEAENLRGRAERERDAHRDALRRLAARLGRVAEGESELERVLEEEPEPEAGAAFAALERITDRLREANDRSLRLVQGGALVVQGARGLRDASRTQGEVLEQLGLATRDMAASLDPLNRERQAAGEVARSSGAEARRAGASVSQALEELSSLQTAAEDCATRVQRLEGAAEEMLSVRELVEDVSELGKLLSLNVAIQASVDPGASAVLGAFAGEVQRLSERARGALDRVDGVQKELRDEAGRAARAIEDALANARTAIARARDAGTGLKALDEAARRLSEVGERLEHQQRDHARRVTAVVRSITEVHRATGQLRAQVDLAMDSSLALADAGAGVHALPAEVRESAGAQVLPLHGDPGPGRRGSGDA